MIRSCLVALSSFHDFGLLKGKRPESNAYMAIAKAEEHPYTAPAKIVNGALAYEKD